MRASSTTVVVAEQTMNGFDRDPQIGEWLELVARVREQPATPSDQQWATFERLSAERDPELGPMPAWWPTDDRLNRSVVGQLCDELRMSGYNELHRWSTEHRAEFWRLVIDRLGIRFTNRPSEILGPDSTPTDPQWLPGAELNIVDSCFQPSNCTVALVAGKEGSDDLQTVTYGELEAQVNRVANGLVKQGFSPGDGIALFMPMNLHCVVAYLAAIRAGCCVVSIADSFAPHEVERRLRIARARGIVTVTQFVRGGKRIGLYDKVLEADAPRAIVIGRDRSTALRDGDLWWDDMVDADDRFASVSAEPDAVTNVLFSSGTTGDPKAIPWTHLTPIKAAADGMLHQDIRPGGVVAWPTNIGWMMGPWLIYAALINRAVLALYEGAPNDSGFCRFVERAGVTMLGVVPSLVRAWRQSGACDTADWSRVEVFSSTGEPSNRADSLWLMSRSGYRAPVIEYCGGTEIGGGYITGTVAQPAAPATFSTPALGLDLVLLDDEGAETGVGTDGEVFLLPPSIGLSQTLLNKDHHEVYYEGCPSGPVGQQLRRHGDQLERLPGGYYRAHGRADDTMNLGGIKVSSVELENVIEDHEAVAECAAVAVQLEDQSADRLVVFAVLSAAIDPSALKIELGRKLARDLNPLFKIHDVVVVQALPRTASNKLMRRTLRATYLQNTG
jgi:acetyl-CoA synthetase